MRFKGFGLADVLCLLIFSGAGAWAAEKEERQALDLERLVPLMRKYQLPEPPGDASLVLVHTHSWTTAGKGSNSRDPAFYAPAFLLEKKAGGQVVVMRGWETTEVEVAKKTEPLIRTFSLEEPKPRLGGYLASFKGSDSFITAIQLGARGENETAQSLWKSYCGGLARWAPEMAFDVDYQKEQLGEAIFIHFLNAAREGRMEWKLARDRLKSCLMDFPVLGRDGYVGSPKEIYERLDLAVEAKSAKAGSVEDLLVRWSRTPGSSAFYSIWENPCGEVESKHEPARQIVMRGYAAIPELELLTNDRRFTARTIFSMGARARPIECPMRLGQLAEDLLKGLRGSLKSVEGVNEADGLASAVFEYKDKRIQSVNETPLRILAAKYPERLAPLCTEFTQHAPEDLHPNHLVGVIAEAALPKDVRVSTLGEFAKHGSLTQKHCALQGLATLDEAATLELLLPILRKLPREANGRYWTCPEAAFTYVVKEVSDVRAWSDCLKAAKRSTVGLRMEMMNSMSYGCNDNEELCRDLRLAFLAAFLDDDEVRNRTTNGKKYDGPCAAFRFLKIQVRNFAAMQVASVLEMGEEPDEYWDAGQWSKLRGKVRARLLEMKLPALAP
ncbi:hypothetical protein [Prosthecobacter sp.]|uniref:hypothetical protein n=1 Tax=Prosthecobacter sp. TaxID=1965333 RepID=UPI003782E226